MDFCQKDNHQDFQIIGICQQCEQDYLGCKLCFAEYHYQHVEDFLLIDNILFLVHQVMQKLELARQKLKAKNLLNNSDLNSFIRFKYNQLKEIRTQFINQTFQKTLQNLQQFTRSLEDIILCEILSQLIKLSSFFKDYDLQNIKQIFLNQFEAVSKENQILLMFDRCRLLYSIQKYDKALQISYIILQMTNRKYFLNQSLLEFNEEAILKSDNYYWNLESIHGRNLYLIQEYNKSLDFFKKLCNQNQNEQNVKECYIYISLNLIQTQQYTQALDYITKYRIMDPDNIIISYFEGYALEKMNEIEYAIDQYQIVAQRTNELFYNLIYGKILHKYHHQQQALDVFEKIILDANQNEIAQIYKCLILLKLKKIEPALKQAEILINTKQNSVYGYVLKGIILKIQENKEEAEKMCNLLQEQFPNNRWTQLFQSIMLCLDNKFREAYKQLQKIKNEEYIKDNLQSIQVICLLKINKVPEAFEILREMQKEDNYNTLLQDAFMMIKQNGMYNFGAQQFGKLVELNPKDALALQFQGQCYYFSLNYDEAIKCFDGALTLNSRLSQCYFYKGQSLYRKIDFKQALINYMKASNLSEQFRSHQMSFHKGNLLFFQFEFDKALEAYESSISMDVSQIMKAIVYWLKNRNEEAIILAEKQLKQFQDVSYMLSRLYKELRHEYQAEFHLDQFNRIKQQGTYNLMKKNYDYGQIFIQYMKQHSATFEEQNDRLYEIIKYAAWFLDEQAYDVCYQCISWNYQRFFYYAINIEQNRKLIDEQVKHIAKYPII